MINWERQKKVKALYELCSKPVRTEYGLTQMEYSVLMFLRRNPGGDTASEIVRTGGFTKSHVSSAIRSLELRGLIKREYQGNNNKTIHIRLTGLADELLGKLAAADERYVKLLFAGFSEEELDFSKELFNKVCLNAEKALREMAPEE